MRFPVTASATLLFLLSAVSAAAAVAGAADSDPPPAEDPNTDPECTVTSPFSNSFFDLRPLRRVPSHDPPQHDWIVKGQDYGANFTINICGPVISDIKIKNLDEKGKNVSAFYEKDGEQFSIGYASPCVHEEGLGEGAHEGLNK